MARTYAEHIEWCKNGALASLPDGPKAAALSFMSDLNKNDETKPLLHGPLGQILSGLALGGGTADEVREFIEGF